MVNGLAIDGAHLYWTTTNGTSIGRANLDGSDQSPQFIPGLEDTCGVAVNGSFLYWGGVLAIGRLGLAGGNAEPNWLITNLENAVTGVAVDSLPSPPPLPPKSRPAEITAVKHDRRKGSVLVGVQVPVAGKLRVLAPRFAWKILGKKSRAAEVPPGAYRIKLWPGSKGTLSESLRNRLLKRGRASAKLKLSLKEFGKDPAMTEKVTFAKARLR
jgi:hypothetical protein